MKPGVHNRYFTVPVNKINTLDLPTHPYLFKLANPRLFIDTLQKHIYLSVISKLKNKHYFSDSGLNLVKIMHKIDDFIGS